MRPRVLLSIFCFWSISGFALAEATDSVLFWGEIPKGEITYKLQTGAQASFFGALMARGEFVSQSAFQDLKDMDQITIVHDTPWSPFQSNTTRTQVEILGRELSSERQERLKLGWAQSPFEVVEAVGGERRVSREEKELLARAQQAAQQVLDQAHTAAAPERATQVAPTTTDAASQPGWMVQYGGHIVVIVAGLLVTGLILKTMVLH